MKARRIITKESEIFVKDEDIDTSDIDPKDYGCKNGVITWEYLDALYDKAYPEDR